MPRAVLRAARVCGVRARSPGAPHAPVPCPQGTAPTPPPAPAVARRGPLPRPRGTLPDPAAGPADAAGPAGTGKPGRSCPHMKKPARGTGGRVTRRRPASVAGAGLRLLLRS
ncbi:hypothetical protein GCM10009549_42780 [Streptomyces thermoalcalitolerans]|uniref:Uncharacterized protein n=1 Tax=Streptomyces thermoalcalitolerans TaxID=65605 RepID=A0ABP3ZIY3_9ACTN